jgi:hypothetical protein
VSFCVGGSEDSPCKGKLSGLVRVLSSSDLLMTP